VKDVEKYCPDVTFEKDQGKFRDCLKSNVDKLSPTCSSSITKVRSMFNHHDHDNDDNDNKNEHDDHQRRPHHRRRHHHRHHDHDNDDNNNNSQQHDIEMKRIMIELRLTCEHDVEKYCFDFEKQENFKGLKVCMMTNFELLSSPCQTSIKKMQEMMMKMKEENGDEGDTEGETEDDNGSSYIDSQTVDMKNNTGHKKIMIVSFVIGVAILMTMMIGAYMCYKRRKAAQANEAALAIAVNVAGSDYVGTPMPSSSSGYFPLHDNSVRV
jgi:hypothetical protein